jgi:four helix bundle protein
MSLPHENLVAWQRADDLFIEVHRLTHQRFPKNEQFELGSQMRRCAWSIPANIVEGIADGVTRDSIRFLKIARRSLNELGYGLHSARRLGYIILEEFEKYQEKLKAIGGPLQRLIKKRQLTVGAKAVGTIALAILAMSISVM